MTEEKKNLVKFAVRTILIYERNAAIYTNYEFSLIAGAVLNVLSAVYDGRKVDRVLRGKLIETFPGLEPRDATTLKTEIKRLQEALAAKTGWYSIEKDDRQIACITVQSANQQVPKTYGWKDLNDVFISLKAAITTTDEYRAIYDYEVAEFNRQYQ